MLPIVKARVLNALLIHFFCFSLWEGGLRTEYAIMELQKAAASVGIRILMEGEIPASEKIQKVFLVSAMECLLNAYQYADATELHIAVIRNKQRRCVLIRYSNNGKQPAGHIQAGGGLTLVRQAAEEAKGTVRWSDHPDFSLEIELPLP